MYYMKCDENESTEENVCSTLIKERLSLLTSFIVLGDGSFNVIQKLDRLYMFSHVYADNNFLLNLSYCLPLILSLELLH